MSFHQISFWEYQSYFHNRDIVVVGAGLTGLFTAIKIKEAVPDASVLVIEDKIIGSGASSRNAGFACFGSISELESDTDQYGLDACLELVEKRYKGLIALNAYMGNAIDYAASGGYEVFTETSTAEKYFDRVTFWNEQLSEIIKNDLCYTVVNNDQSLNFVNRAICNQKEGLLDTGLLNKRLEYIVRSMGIDILRGVKLTAFEDVNDKVFLTLDTLDRPVQCRQLVLCTNAFTKQLIKTIEIIPSRNQVLMTTPVDNSALIGGYHLDKGYIYFRPVGDRVLIGGGRHVFSEEDNQTRFESNSTNLHYLMDILRSRVLPNQKFEIDFQWSGILSGGSVRTPVIRRHSDNVVMGVRLGGMGVAIGINVAEETANLVLQRMI